MTSFYQLSQIVSEIISPIGYKWLGSDLAEKRRSLYENSSGSRIEFTLEEDNKKSLLQFNFRFRTLNHFYIDIYSKELQTVSQKAPPEFVMLELRNCLEALVEQYFIKFSDEWSMYNYMLDQYLVNKRKITKDFFLFYYKSQQQNSFKDLDWIEKKINLINQNLNHQNTFLIYDSKTSDYKSIHTVEELMSHFKTAV